MNNLTYIYVHINPETLIFSNELIQSEHTFTQLPSYAHISFEQTKKITGISPVVLTNDWLSENNLTNEIKDFYSLCKEGMPSFYKNTFWLTTLLRLFVVYLYCREKQIEKFIHLEYDNLIYSNFDSLNILEPGVYFTKVGELYGSAGFVFCNNFKCYEEFIFKLKALLQKGEQVIKRFTPVPFLSEMILINLIGNHTKNIVSFLPTLPFEPSNDNFEKIKMVFDCASYGQYIGGTNDGQPPGWTGNHHYIGEQLQTKSIEAYFDQELKTPFIKYKNAIIPIGNLHIHSKKLNLYC